MSESDCKDALHQLYDFLDGELTEDKRAAIKHHLDTCQPCAEPYDFEAELRLIIRKKCAETVPDSLISKIRDALDAEAKATG
jgi:mycothiol system anti-sigma-R factor